MRPGSQWFFTWALHPVDHLIWSSWSHHWWVREGTVCKNRDMRLRKSSCHLCTVEKVRRKCNNKACVERFEQTLECFNLFNFLSRNIIGIWTRGNKWLNRDTWKCSLNLFQKIWSDQEINNVCIIWPAIMCNNLTRCFFNRKNNNNGNKQWIR